MQTRELNRTTIGVANTTGKERSIGRIPGLSGLGSLMAAGSFVALALIPARADEKSDMAGLQTQVAALQTQVNRLQNQLTEARSVLALAPFVSVDPNPEDGVIGPNITFKGANIHIISGFGATTDRTSGLGNLIIGYDEVPSFTPLSPGDRGGSHNLVIGRFNTFTQAAFGGLVAGESNRISAAGASVSGGSLNTASGFEASVSGGDSNTASGNSASVLGGAYNTAGGLEASVSGGADNTAGGVDTVVIGGVTVTDNNNTSIAPSPPFP